ncbi:glycosyltransferase family 9 protein [Dysgonomonas sp. 216]|uniref:glycosyltransferase family 9 protein n=1 Tax=Dysgonomonas sp. 216 TaxID=2302934 RepID=UPI0013D3F3D5|nr:glycosyltransferase family 9 protein [Dysgonomonas sp. 216]NDW18185.1 glycosyltransferase family 9 protein [Dysgonomonas sp. 216]
MEIERILVIRFRRVGDAILSSALCSSLRKTFPNAEIHYVLNEEIAPLFEGHPDIDKIITFSKKEMSGLFTYLKKVRSTMKTGKYDIIIDTRATVKTMFFLPFSLRTKYRIGRKKEYNMFAHNYRVYNYPNGTRSLLHLTLDLLDPLNADFNVVKDVNFRIYVTDKEKETFARYMESEGIDHSKPVIICAIATRLEHKMWDKDKMLTVLNRIQEKYPEAQLIFNYGGEREKALVSEIYEALGKPKNVFINIEAKTLRELPAMMKNADFFFGIEGGPRHMAQATQLPAFAIYPPGINMVDWLPNPSESNQGISLMEIKPEAVNDDTLTFEQKYAFYDVETIWSRLDKMLERFLSIK